MLEFPHDVNDESTSSFDVVFTVIAFLASGFSGYTTYLGFSYDLPLLPSMIIAIIIGLGLLIINLRIRDARRAGDRLRKPLTAFFVFLLFSFISNTNAIYTYFLQRDIVGATQTNSWQVFDEGTIALLSYIEDNPAKKAYQEKRKALDLEINNLKNQIVDANNPGMGEKAKEHLRNIEQILGSTLTRLNPPRGLHNRDRYTRYANEMERLINKQFNARFSTTNVKEIEKLKEEIMALRKFHENKVLSKEFSRIETDTMSHDLNTLCLKTKKITNLKINCPKIDTTPDDIGSFQYTWTNFVNGVKKAAIILSVLLSLMLDTLTPLLSILLYKKEEKYNV